MGKGFSCQYRGCRGGLTTAVLSVIMYSDENKRRISVMKHIQSINTRDLCESAKNGGCGECQTSCQSACKTSCGIANQKCEKETK